MARSGTNLDYRDEPFPRAADPRHRIAERAMHALVSRCGIMKPTPADALQLAKAAYTYADAMMNVRDERAASKDVGGSSFR